MRTDVGVSHRRWVAFLEESCELADEPALSGRDGYRVRALASDPEPFGLLELRPESGFAGAHVVNELLMLVRAHDPEGGACRIAQARAQLDAMRCFSPREYAAHEIAGALADFALGEHDGLPVRVAIARGMADDAFTMSAAIAIALSTGNVVAASALADDAITRFFDDPRVVYQIANVRQCTFDFRAAIDASSRLFDLAEAAGVSAAEKRQLALRMRSLGELVELTDAHDLDASSLIAQIQFAVDRVRERGHRTWGIELVTAGWGASLLEIQIDAEPRRCRVLHERLGEALRTAFGRAALHPVMIVYMPSRYRTLSRHHEHARASSVRSDA